MKKLIALVLILAALFSYARGETYVNIGPCSVSIEYGVLNVREYTDVQSKVVSTLKKDTELSYVLGSCDGFVEVGYLVDGEFHSIGWCAEKYLRRYYYLDNSYVIYRGVYR